MVLCFESNVGQGKIVAELISTSLQPKYGVHIQKLLRSLMGFTVIKDGRDNLQYSDVLLGFD